MSAGCDEGLLPLSRLPSDLEDSEFNRHQPEIPLVCSAPVEDLPVGLFPGSSSDMHCQALLWPFQNGQAFPYCRVG